jgi:hypothetical protein
MTSLNESRKYRRSAAVEMDIIAERNMFARFRPKDDVSQQWSVHTKNLRVCSICHHLQIRYDIINIYKIDSNTPL